MDNFFFALNGHLIEMIWQSKKRRIIKILYISNNISQWNMDVEYLINLNIEYVTGS